MLNQTFHNKNQHKIQMKDQHQSKIMYLMMFTNKRKDWQKKVKNQDGQKLINKDKLNNNKKLINC